MSLGVGTRASTNDSHSSLPRSSKLAAGVVIGLMIVYIVFFSTLSIRQHRAFATHGFDLGAFDQGVWNTLHGRFMRMTNEEETDHGLGIHFYPIVALLSPLYLIYGSPETLLVVQSIALALSVWPVFRLTAEKLRSAWGGTVFAFVYLMFPALQGASLSEFHAVTLGAGFLAWAFYSLHRDRAYLFGLFAFLAMSCKEDIPLIVAMMGLYAFFIQKKRGLGLATIGVGLLWFVVAVKVVIPHFNASGRSIHLDHFSYLGHSLEEVIASILTRPELVLNNFQDKLKVGYLLRLCFPAGFLSLLAPQVLLIPAPAIAINFLSTHYTMYALDKFWGSVTAVPFIVISAGWGAAFLVRLVQHKLRVKRGFLLTVFSIYALIFTVFYHARFGYTPLGSNFLRPRITSHHRLGEQLAKTIPSEAIVVAQDHLFPHVSQRETIYVFPNNIADAEYIFLDVSAPPGYVVSDDEYRAIVRDLLEDGRFAIVHSQDGYLILKKGAGNNTLESEFYDFTRADGIESAQPIDVRFGTTTQLKGVLVTRLPGMIVQVESYWQAVETPQEDTHIYLGLFDQDAKPFPDTIHEIRASTWYPLDLWPPGETVRDQAMIQLPAYTEVSSIYVGFFVAPDTAEPYTFARETVLRDAVQTDIMVKNGILLIPAWQEPKSFGGAK